MDRTHCPNCNRPLVVANNCIVRIPDAGHARVDWVLICQGCPVVTEVHISGADRTLAEYRGLTVQDLFDFDPALHMKHTMTTLRPSPDLAYLES
jgi:hypothetical protein